MFEFSPDSVNFQEIYKHYLSLISTDFRSYETGLKNLVLPIIPSQILQSLCRNVNYFFEREPMLLRLDIDCVIVGDLHGHILDLFRILKQFGTPPNTKYLFLGDIVDRGEFSVETVTLIFLLKVLFPKDIYIIRGNHEFPEMCHNCGFYSELHELYPNVSIEKQFYLAFSNMPIAALIRNKILCLHGGIGPTISNLTTISNIPRPLNDSSKEPVCSIVWSDPSNTIQGYSPSSRGSGHFFGQDVLLKFLQQNSLELLVRGHQCVEKGIDMQFNRRLVTVFSASNYCGSLPNKAGVLSIENNGMKKQATVFNPLRYLFRQKAVLIPSLKQNVFTISKAQIEEAETQKHLPTISQITKSTPALAQYKGPTYYSSSSLANKRNDTLLEIERDKRKKKSTIKLGKRRAQSEYLMNISPEPEKYIRREKSVRKIDARRFSNTN